MMGSTLEFSTSECSALAAWGNGVVPVPVRFACTRAPYSSGRMRKFTIHLWNQAPLSARVAISPIVAAASAPPRVPKGLSVLEPIYGLPGFSGAFIPDSTRKAVKYAWYRTSEWQYAARSRPFRIYRNVGSNTSVRPDEPPFWTSWYSETEVM